MSAHLQFGPEWMRKGPGKTSSAMGGATTGSNSNHESSTSPVGPQEGGAGLTSPTSAVSGKVGLGQVHKRTNPSLGNLSAANAGGAAALGTGGGAPSGPAATSPAATTPLSGGFSFAAAAQGGAMKEATTPTSSSSSIALPHSSEGDSARYSKRLLSLYSTERGGKTAPTAPSEAPTSPNASLKKKPTLASGGVPSDRDTRRSASAAQDSFSAPRSHSPGGEARGLNARTASSSQDKAIRPGLFQRGSAGASNSSAALPTLSPTLFQSRERDRHGSGFQGGVLSGVLAPPSSRRRKESELGLDTLRSPRPGQEGDSDQQQHHQQQSGRRQIDNLPSGRSRSVRTSTHEPVPAFPDGTSLAGGIGSTPAVTSNGETIETWSRLGGRRERAPGEGPIGPPADHSGGFSKFSGYERRRERQASNMAGHRRSHEGLRIHSRRDDEGGAQSSGDVDLSKHATYVLNSLKLDGDEEDGELLRQQHEALFQQQQQQEQQQQQQQQDKAEPAWSPTTQDWFYRDPSGQVQGPFKANLMQEWYKAKYFSDDLLVRRAEEDDFQALGDKLNFIGNDSTPFLTPPSEYVGARREAAPPMFEPAVSAHQGLPSAGAFQPPQPLGHLGWPSNLDVRSHFGAASGNSSPFGTPQGRYAELDNSQRMREQYVEMIRQRELAEHRAMQEQQAAQMAAIAMAQAQGRDPASMGLWASSNFGNGEWNQAPRGHPTNGYILQDDAIHQHWQQQQQQQQQLHQQQQQHHGHEQYEHQQQHTPLQQHHPHNQQHHDSLQHLQQQPQYQQQHAQAEPLEPVWQADGQARDLEQDQSGVTAERLLAEVDGTDEGETVRQHLAHVEPQEEEEEIAQAGAESQQEHVSEVVSQAQDEPEQNQAVEEEQAAPEEESLEQAWPQSPSAVEFASEPLMTDEQWSKEESPSRGKKSRRDRARQRTDEEAKSDRADKQRNFASGNVKTVSEDQFRSSQGKDSASSGQQAPLSSWLPDTADANGAAPAKTAPWANSQQDGSTAGMSLREIQEAEAKQAESRKANRPKMQLSLSTSGEAALPSTMTWGLAGSYSASTPREVSGTATPPPAWNAKQAPKKTLTEIQEEERARAQRAKEAQVLARSKAYADSASKVQTGLPAPAAGNPAGGNWSVVGAGGKAPGAVVARPVKVAATTTSPAVQRTVSGASTWSNGGAVPVASNGPTNRTQMARKVSSQAINGSDGSPAPSPEFIRHCKEQLKGLNVKVDDFIEMLLSFPLDPSPDVVDIIAESVYASSSTLDGRRFAADFVAKRKLDAGFGNGKKGNALASSSFANGPASATPTVRTASDILKSTPASTDGFGGFKVVKTKGAKKRA